MSSDNLDSGCSTCGSEKSDCELQTSNTGTFLNGSSSLLLSHHRSSSSPKSVAQQKLLFGGGGSTTSTSSDSPSSSQESFARILSSSQSYSANCSENSPKSATHCTTGRQMPEEPKSPGGSSGASAGGTPVRLRKHTTTTAAPTRFRFPAVAFFRKKKSWPNLLPANNSSTDDSLDLVMETSLMITSNTTTNRHSHNNVNNNHKNVNNKNNNTFNNSSTTGNHGGNVEFRMIKNLPRYSSSMIAATAEYSDPELRDSSVESTFRAREKARKVNSREDPLPVRETGIGGVFCDPFSSVFASSGASSSSASATKSASCPSIHCPPNGTKLKFIREGQIQICRLNHPRTVLGKLTSSKLLRRWESHFLVLDDEEITSKTPNGFMEQPIRYASMEDIHCLPQWDCSGDKFCVRIFVPEGSILLQCMVEQVKCSPLQGDNLSLKSVVLISRLFEQIYIGNLPRTMLDPIITCAASLLDTVAAVTEISPWLSRYCNDFPRSRLIDDVLSDVAQQTLKKTMDFGKYPTARVFIQDYIMALSTHNNGLQRVRNFVCSVHGPASSCPHPRVLPNLVSVCLAAVHSCYDGSSTSLSSNEYKLPSPAPSTSIDLRAQKLECFCSIFETISEFEDWRLPLASLLQPVPFPEEVLSNETFASCFARVLRRMGTDSRCEIHLSVLGVREGKEGWFHLVCPGGPACSDDGELFSQMLKTLIHCCCRRKKFLQNLNGMLGPLQLLALRENEAAMEALCHMLEFEVVEGEDLKLQMITALQSTCGGRKHYASLCDRQTALRELQQKGGPRKLTLPSKSTDADLAVLLSSGSFGNLEWLSLAFTNVTSTCADYLIKLPSLKYLNLWSTQFGDAGLQLLSEHLLKLQVLNLCETPVTDKGLLSLAALKNLRKLNLNSTQLSSKTFQTLKAELPALQEVDVRYTDAWCADEFLT